MTALTCGFIGLGLIGGSIAKAIRQNLPEAHLIACDINADTLELAKKEGVINETSDHISDIFRGCDYIFLCAPVSHNDENLLVLREHLSPETILTDVGSVKTGIHEQIASLGLESQFIGGHPMAGSERFGYQNAKAALLENAYYIMTPSDAVAPEKISAYRNLIETMGAIPLTLTYAQHDYVTAAISHLPHIIAASLVNLVKDADSADGIMKMIAAGGFKDITRIASSSPQMWQQICLTNTENISDLLQQYIENLIKIAKIITKQESDEIYSFFDSARTYRESFTAVSSGPIKAAQVLTVDIADKPGSIAAIAALLAEHEVSIKNIGINHNRELAEGALRIEFYDDAALESAQIIMKDNGYSIHAYR